MNWWLATFKDAEGRARTDFVKAALKEEARVQIKMKHLTARGLKLTKHALVADAQFKRYRVSVYRHGHGMPEQRHVLAFCPEYAISVSIEKVGVGNVHRVEVYNG